MRGSCSDPELLSHTHSQYFIKTSVKKTEPELFLLCDAHCCGHAGVENMDWPLLDILTVTLSQSMLVYWLEIIL